MTDERRVELQKTWLNHNYWPRPIPVSERLPVEETYVLAFGADPPNLGYSMGWDIRLFHTPVYETGWEGEATVTHWLPLPPKPE